jgi:hypothetical protein
MNVPLYIPVYDVQIWMFWLLLFGALYKGNLRALYKRNAYVLIDGSLYQLLLQHHGTLVRVLTV